MSFIEMTGTTLERIVADDELHHDDLAAAGVNGHTIVRINRQGVGYLQPDDRNEPELTIPSDCTSTALHNDHVLVRRDVRPLSASRRGRSPGLARTFPSRASTSLRLHELR